MTQETDNNLQSNSRLDGSNYCVLTVAVSIANAVRRCDRHDHEQSSRSLGHRHRRHQVYAFRDAQSTYRLPFCQDAWSIMFTSPAHYDSGRRFVRMTIHLTSQKRTVGTPHSCREWDIRSLQRSRERQDRERSCGSSFQVQRPTKPRRSLRLVACRTFAGKRAERPRHR